MIGFLCCIKKDTIEFTRTKKNILFGIIQLLVTGMVISVTKFFPALIEKVVEKAPEIMADGSQFQQVLLKLFPQNTMGSMGIWSSDVVIVFSIVIALTCCSLLPEEIRSGKWILVLEAGYRKWQLVLSKIIVYSTGTALSILIGYNLYYIISKFVIEDNYSFQLVSANSVVLSIAVFFITAIAISISVIYKNHVTAVITIIMTLLVAPDILTMFSFGKYFPTYLLTFVYNSSSCYRELIVPGIVLLLLQIFLFGLAMKRIDNVEVPR